MNIGKLLRMMALPVILPVMLPRCSASLTSRIMPDPCAPDVIGSSASYIRGGLSNGQGGVLVRVEGREISVTPEVTAGSDPECQINIDTVRGTYGPIPLEVDINSPQMRECLNRPIMAAAGGEPVHGNATDAANLERCIEHLLNP